MQQALRFVLIAVLLTGCARFPQLNGVVSEEAQRADYPELIPADRLLAKRSLGRLGENSGKALLARASLLRARARVLRSITEVNDETRLRIAPLLRRLGG